MTNTLSAFANLNKYVLTSWIVTAFIFLIDVCWIIIGHFLFSVHSLYILLAIVLFLCLLLYFYSRIRHRPHFILMIRVTILLLIFTACGATFSYLVVTTNLPLADHWLVGVDHFFGFYLPSIVKWINHHPWLNLFLMICYQSSFPQCIFLILYCGFIGAQRVLDDFMLQFILAAFITIMLSAWLPAAGPFVWYDYPMDKAQSSFIHHFYALREGMKILTLEHAEGMVTFPSFHTTLALITTYAFRHQHKIIFLLIALLNFFVIFSTLTTGWHYLADVVGGIIVFGVVLLLEKIMQREKKFSLRKK